MPCKILTPDVISIDALLHDHHAVLAKSAGGAVAVFANNAPAFYALTPARLAQLLALEEKLSRPGSDVTLDAQFYEEPQAAPVAVPMGKFAMYADWQPDADFQRRRSVGLGVKRTGHRRGTGLIRRLLAGRRQSLSPYSVAAKTGA